MICGSLAYMLCGCEKQKPLVSGDGETTEEPGINEEEGIDREEYKVSAAGPYGEMTVTLPVYWSYEITDADGEAPGLYGIRFRPETENDGWISLFYTDSFGVCGTGLVTGKTVLAGEETEILTYDDHPFFDMAAYGGKKKGIIASCESSWASDHSDEIMRILDTVQFDPQKTEGAAFVFTPESEVEEIGVCMELRRITASGAAVCFRNYISLQEGDLVYGEAYVIEKLENDEWMPVTQITPDAVFTDIGYIIPTEGESQLETDWEWLYGKLEKGTYRMKKTVLAEGKAGYRSYEVCAQFLIAG